METFPGADGIFHQAAIPSVPRSVKNPLASNEANVTGTVSVLVAAKDCGVPAVVGRPRFTATPHLIQSDDRSGSPDPLQVVVTSPDRSGDRTPTLAPSPGHGIDIPGFRERFEMLVVGCPPDLKAVPRWLSAIVRMRVSGSGADSRISGGFIFAGLQGRSGKTPPNRCRDASGAALPVIRFEAIYCFFSPF